MVGYILTAMVTFWCKFAILFMFTIQYNITACVARTSSNQSSTLAPLYVSVLKFVYVD